MTEVLWKMIIFSADKMTDVVNLFLQIFIYIKLWTGHKKILITYDISYHFVSFDKDNKHYNIALQLHVRESKTSNFTSLLYSCTQLKFCVMWTITTKKDSILHNRVPRKACVTYCSRSPEKRLMRHPDRLKDDKEVIPRSACLCRWHRS